MMFSKRVDFKNEKISKTENDFTASQFYKPTNLNMRNNDVVDNNTLQKQLISKDIGVEPTVMTDEYKKEEIRLESFRYWDVNYICKEKLSLTGFYFIGPNDMCKCYFCKVEIGLWEAGDNVLTEHLRWSPNCPLLRRRLTDNEPINQGQLEEILPPASYDVCGAARSINIRPNAYPEVAMVAAPIVQTTELPTVLAPRHPNHPDFVLETDRLRSYADWPKTMKQKPKELSDAGYFYIGKGDKVKCFSCGGGLRDWEEGDDPWEQHARWYSDCDYLKLIKGSVYIKEVLEKAKREVETSTVSQPSSSSSLATQEVKSVAVTAETPEDENKKLNDLKLCKICYINEYNTAFFPCGHVVACAKCASSVTKCPLCRESFTNVMRVYFS